MKFIFNFLFYFPFPFMSIFSSYNRHGFTSINVNELKFVGDLKGFYVLN